jgi:hypothetical protein
MKLFYKQFFLLIAAFLTIQASAQISVTATTGTTGPTTYTTLKAAFDAINAGTHTGSITVSVTANTTETASAVLNSSGTGSASYTAVLIRPTAAATISGTLAAPLIDLNGAKNVTIDGRIGSTGTTRSLTISNLSASGTAATSTIRMISSAQDNSVIYNNIQGSTVLGTTGLVATILIDSSLTGTGNRNITISNNDIGAAGANTPSVAIYSAGESTTAPNMNITVNDNLIHDFFNPAGLSAGIVADIFSEAWTINGNSIYQTAARTSTAAIFHAGIYMNAGDGHTINNNFIGGGAANAGGTATTIAGGFSNRFFGMLFSVGTTTASTVNGNTITNINISSTPAASANVFTGIQVDDGNVNIGVTTGNTIGSLTGTGAITLNISGASTSFNDGIISFSDGIVNVRNNNIGSISTTGTATGTVVLRGIEAYAYTSATVDGNVIGGTTASSIQANTANNQMGGIFLYQYLNNTTSVVNNNTIRNFTNNATGANAAVITGINSQVQVNAISVVNTVTNNQINNLSSPGTSATVGSVLGISLGIGTSIVPTGQDGNINNNTIHTLSSASTATSFAVRGIQNALTYPNFLNINGNTIHTITAAAPNTAATSAVVAQGISSSTSGAGTLSMEGNTIYNIEATATGAATAVVGLAAFYGSTTNSALISKNRIYDLRNPNALATGFVTGIVLRGTGATAGTFNVINNMVSLAPANVMVFGIANNAVALAVNSYYNSVYIGGTATGANNSAAYIRLSIATPTIIKNNIFYNVRTGGTGVNVAVANTNTTPATGWSSDFNNLYSTTAANIALWGTTPQDLATYKTTAADVNSKSVTVTFVNAATADLHLSGASTTDANLNGTPITGITVDFDNDTRSTTTPKMGADEPVLVCVAPAITTQPAAVTACAGTAANFSVTATGTSLTYQWRKGTSNIAGATSATFTIASVAVGDAGNYNVVITNGCGTVTSADAALTVTAAPVITTQPAAVTVCSGSAANFSVVATGTALTYQWRKDGTDIGGATSATYSIAAATAANAGTYTVRVTSGTCSVTSSGAVLTVTPPTVITTQPQAVTTCLQQNATFTVVATGGAGLTYQWKKDGNDIAGATSATYVVNNVTSASAGNYSVVVTGPGTGLCGSVTSNNALLTVSGPCTSIPNIDQDITGVVLLPNVVNTTATLRVNAGRSTQIQWNVVDMNGKIVMRFNSAVTAGQNDIKLIVSQLGAGIYQIMGTSSKGRTEVVRMIKL